MKKKKKICVILLLVSSLTFSQPLCISAQQENEQMVETVCDEGIPDSSKAVFYIEYNRLPEYIKELVSSSDVTIYLDSDRENTGKGNSGLFTAWVPEGEFHYKYDINIDASHTYNVVFAALHEIGHLIDSILGETSGNKGSYYSAISGFSQIYLAEATSSGLGVYAASSLEEYFAEAFKVYFQNPERLKENAPLTFQYVENICILLSGIVLDPAA